MTQKDRLIKAILRNQELLFNILKTVEDDEPSDSDENTSAMIESDKLTEAMVKAIKMTRSPNRTFGTNGSYS